MDLFQGGLFNGICFGIAAIGISLPLRFLGTADFTSIGAYMLGGILSIYFANLTSSLIVGLFLGLTLSGMLGLVTAFMSINKHFSVPLMLGGIITFTASRSFGLLVAQGGSINLSAKLLSFSPIFSWLDVFVVAIVALSLCFLLGIVARSKYGCLAFALCSNTNFVKFRHTMSNTTTYWIMFISNALVGLSGSLMVYKMGTAYVQIDLEFLSLSIGAIFSGDVFVRLVMRALKQGLPAEVPFKVKEITINTTKSMWQEFRLKLSPQRDDSERMWFILFSYTLAAVILSDIGAAVGTKNLFNIPAELEHVVIAVLIITFLLLSNIGKNGKVSDESN